MPRSLVLALSLAACAGQKVRPPSADVEVLTDDARLEPGLAKAVLRLPWELQNRSSAQVQVDAVAWTLSAGELAPQSGTATPSASAPSGGGAEGELVLEIPFDTSDAAFSARDALSAIPYAVDASFKVGTAAGPAEFVTSWAGELFPSKRPRVKVTGQATRYEQNLELDFTLAVVNPNAFPVEVARLSYEVRVEGTVVSSGALTPHKTVPPNSELEFELSRSVGRDDLIELAKQLVKQSSLAYEIDTELEAGGLTHPGKASATMQFSR